jgi:chaperonin cofactor prefoldin
MKIKAIFWIAISIISIFSYMIFPMVNAETFNIGTKIADSDFGWVTFSSGIVVTTERDYLNYTSSIFDGDLSTGLDHDFGPGHDYASFILDFPYKYYINNLTIKPSFGGNVSKYSISIFYLGGGIDIVSEANTPDTININRTLDGIRLTLNSNGTNHFYFNDLIINYTPSASNLDQLQIQINELKQQFYLLNNQMNELNNSINDMNQTQDEIPENVSNLLIRFDQLNESFANFTDEIDNLKNDIFQLESKNSAFMNEIEDLTLEIENLKDNEKEKIIDKQRDNSLVYGAFIIGILGIILALIAIGLISKRLNQLSSSTEKEELENSDVMENNDE